MFSCLLFNNCKAWFDIILAPLIRSFDDPLRSIECRSWLPFLIAIFDLNSPISEIFLRNLVKPIIHLAKSIGVSVISNCIDVSISVFTFKRDDEIHSSKFISILDGFLFFVFRNESFMRDCSIEVCFEFRIVFFSWIRVWLNYRINNFFNFRAFLNSWIFYWGWLLIVKPKGSIFLSWISSISFLNSLLARESSLCFVSYFAFTFFNSSWRRYSWTFHESEFCFIFSFISCTLSTSLWNHCAS